MNRWPTRPRDSSSIRFLFNFFPSFKFSFFSGFTQMSCATNWLVTYCVLVEKKRKIHVQDQVPMNYVSLILTGSASCSDLQSDLRKQNHKNIVPRLVFTSSLLMAFSNKRAVRRMTRTGSRPFWLFWTLKKRRRTHGCCSRQKRRSVLVREWMRACCFPAIILLFLLLFCSFYSELFFEKKVLLTNVFGPLGHLRGTNSLLLSTP